MRTIYGCHHIEEKSNADLATLYQGVYSKQGGGIRDFFGIKNENIDSMLYKNCIPLFNQ